MVNYQNSKIYRLECLNTGLVYIGATTRSLSKRKNEHKTDYNEWINGGKNYVSSFEIIKNNNYDIYLMENYPCNSKEELHSREGYWQKQIDCVNKCISGRPEKQYKIDNKEKIKDQKKKYNEKNNEKNQLYRKDYYQKNKTKILEHDSNREDILCLYCDCYHSPKHIRRHERTLKHKNAVKYFKNI